MGNEKIKFNMSTFEMAMVMSEGNPGALSVVMEMMKDPRGFMGILLCDSLDIRGEKLYMLHNDCCDRENEKFYRTLKMFNSGVFSTKEIQDNFSLVRAIPFIDDSIEIEGVPPYGIDFGPGDDKWDEFCAKNREAFIQKLGSSLEKQKSKKLRLE